MRSACLGGHHVAHQVCRKRQPAPQARRQGLARGAGVHHVLAVQALHGAHGLAVVAGISVVVVPATEDDYDGEFRYDRQPVGAVQGLDGEHVVYAGTASKTLAPGLRLGWLALPAHLVGDVVAAKEQADRNSNTLDQLTLAELIDSGAYDRHIRRSRLAYRRRRDRLVATLRHHAPEVRVTGVAAGLHALLELPAGEREDEVVARAAEHGVAVQGLAGLERARPCAQAGAGGGLRPSPGPRLHLRHRSAGPRRSRTSSG